MPRFKRNFEAVEPTKGLSRFGKVKGMRGKGFFGKAKKECPRRIEILSRLTLGFSLVFVISCALCFVPFLPEWGEEWLALSILSSFFAVHIAFVTCEVGLGYELKYRNWTMGLVWGTIVGIPVLGFLFGVLSG